LFAHIVINQPVYPKPEFVKNAKNLLLLKRLQSPELAEGKNENT